MVGSMPPGLFLVAENLAVFLVTSCGFACVLQCSLLSCSGLLAGHACLA